MPVGHLFIDLPGATFDRLLMQAGDETHDAAGLKRRTAVPVELSDAYVEAFEARLTELCESARKENRS